MGAAIQGGLISGLDVGPVLVDITPHTLGVACIGSVDGHQSPYCHAPIIERNTPLPASRSELFMTSRDGQTEVLISVFQGEHRDVRLNEPVGEFEVEGLADVEEGNPILVRFDLDLNDILTVTATEKRTGLEKKVTIDNAMSRFREHERTAAQARLDAAFSSDEEKLADAVAASEPPASPPLESYPPEVQAAVQEASELIDKAQQLAEEANEVDAEEIRDLLAQLEAAVSRRSPDDIRDVLAKLDDLVFYLQDAT
jgi:molecular chaperone DnaK